jgi:hypothetical protein
MLEIIKRRRVVEEEDSENKSKLSEPSTGKVEKEVTDKKFALMMEAVQTSETLVNSYQSTRRYNPEDSHLHSHRRENLKSY